MERGSLEGILTMCRRAGKLSMGHDLVKESVHKRNAKLVLFARDVSPGTRRDIQYMAGEAQVRCVELPFSMDEMWFLVGKRIGVAAVTDPGFAGRLSGD